ncbi:hypothetical protein [Levilactobacillus brevis]|uniref:hypothetical protein n=1 Tax=Levilactobacillus brevis TaxID=1580 RepID=UPI001BDE8E9C|nr:hypothetical protein [Levilactobacillus brevis]
MLKKEPDDRLATQFFQRDYQDRGMLKWGGFYLSDHTSALRKMHAAEQQEVPQTRQSVAVISERLALAWRTHHHVHFQLNVVDANQAVTVLDGVVAGVADDQIMVQLPAGNYRQLALTAIRCVTVAAQ